MKRIPCILLFLLPFAVRGEDACPPPSGLLKCRAHLIDIAGNPDALRREGSSFVWWDGSAGARPVASPRAVVVETDAAAEGFAVLTLKENKYRNPATFSFTSRCERVTRFVTDVPDGLECRFERLRFLARRFNGKVLSIVGELDRTPAGACRVDVDTGTGDWLRILRDGDAAPALTFFNTSETNLSWKGEAVLEDAFRRQVKVPFDVCAAAGETVRAPLPWPLPARGWWRVTTTVRGADGSKAVSEASLAWIDRHDAAPPLAEGKFRMGLQWHSRRLTARQIERTLDAVVACGAKIVRTGICRRRDIEQKDGTCNWSACDRVVRAVRSRGLALDAGVWANPDWAAPTNLSQVCKEPNHPLVKGRESWLRTVCLPEDLKRCEDFYAKLSAHYGEDIAYYEIGNEWDLYNFYPGTTEDGIEIVKTCYRGIKRGNPKCVVTPCGWAMADAGGRDHRLAARFVNYGIQDRILTEAMGFYDVHAVHMHSGFASFRERVLDKFFPNRRRLGVTVPWFANETAVSTVHGNEIETAKDVWKKIVFSWANGSRDYIWYNLRATGWEKADSEQGYGIITPDFNPRPAYAAFSALSAVFEGLDFDSTLCSEKEGMELCRFRGTPGNARGFVLAGWHNVRTHKGSCRIATDAGKAVAVDMMGNRQELDAANGSVLWPISHFPAALVLEGASRAELAEGGSVAASLPDVVLADNASTNRPPDIVANRADQVDCPYDANPATTDRTWKGVEDCSFRAWLSTCGDGLRIVVEVVDDAVVCGKERGAGDCLKVVARVGGGWRTRAFPASGGRRSGDLLVYDVTLPGPCPDALSLRVDDDDGDGFDLTIGTGEVRLVRGQGATGGVPRDNEKEAYGELSSNIVARLDLWPGLAPHETTRERGRFVFDEKKAVWRPQDVSCPDVILLKPRDVRHDTLVLAIPGGGYMTQNMGTFCRNVRPILDSGRWVAVLHHRIPRRPGRAMYAAPREDGARAIRLLRAQAGRFGYSAEKIGVVGFSAGGNLAALLATSSLDEPYEKVDEADGLPASVSFAVLVYPAYVTDDDRTLRPEFKFDTKTPPMFLMHGDEDEHTSMASVLLYAELHKRRIPAQLFVFAHAAHGLGEKGCVRGWPRRIVDWLDEMGV